MAEDQAKPDADEPADEEKADDPKAPAGGFGAKPDEVVEAPPARKPDYAFLAMVSVASLALDLGTKWWAKKTLEGHGGWDAKRIEVLPGWLRLVFAQNKGGAWGILQEEHDVLRLGFFVVISIAAIAFILSLYR